MRHVALSLDQKTPAQLEQDKLSRAAEKLAELIDAGSFAGGTTAARKEKLAACETPITVRRLQCLSRSSQQRARARLYVCITSIGVESARVTDLEGYSCKL